MSEKQIDPKNKFMHAIANDNTVTKLWKYRSLIQTYPNQAKLLKGRMLDMALRNKLLGEYESIHNLFGVALINIPRIGDYNTFKVEEQALVNRLKVEAGNFQSIGNLEQQIRTYFKLGQVYAQYGDHPQSQLYYSKILRKQTDNPVFRDEEYMPQWGNELFYLISDPGSLSTEGGRKDYHDLELFSMRVFDDKKKINSTFAFIRDVYKLSKKGTGRGRVKVLQHILSPNFTIQQIINNGIFSLMDLGFLYSLLALAHKDRKYLKQDVKWSSKIQIAYLQADYKKLFSEINRHYDNYGQFNPTIRFIFKNCEQEIKKRVFSELFNAYHTISYAKIQNLTAIKPGQIQSFVKNNSNLPYLLDPITQSVVYYEKTTPLYDQTCLLLEIIKEKYQEKEKALITESREEMDFGRMEAMLERRGSDSGSRRHPDFGGFGGMGGLGGFGRHHGM